MCIAGSLTIHSSSVLDLAASTEPTVEPTDASALVSAADLASEGGPPEPADAAMTLENPRHN